MATIETRTGKDGKTTYRARIRVWGHPERTATFTRKTDAKDWAARTESDLKRGRHVPTTDEKRRTVADMIDKYIEDTLPNKPRNKDRAKVAALLGWWREQIGNFSLQNATPSLIAEYRDKLQKEKTPRGPRRSNGTVNRYIAALSHAFKTATVEWGWLDDSPMRRVSRRQEAKGRVRFLSDDERTALLTACKESRSPILYPIVVLALSTGARHGELINLRRRDVDLKRRVITLDETKNGERRVLPLTGHALEIMRGLLAVPRIDTDLIFPGNKPDQPASITTAWDNAIESAGIQNFRFHDLRHTAASYLAMNGATLAELAEILGHKTLAMVKRYAHLTEAHTAKVVERMNDKLFGGEK